MAQVSAVRCAGGPGSGKGTQCERIVERYGFTHLRLGDLLRDELKSGSSRAAQLQVMESGGLVSLDVVLELLKDAMLRTAHSARGFLVDGFPRELERATRFEAEVRSPLLLLLLLCETQFRQQLSGAVVLPVHGVSHQQAWARQPPKFLKNNFQWSQPP